MQSTSTFGELSTEKQVELVQQAAAILKANDLGSVPVRISRESVCPLAASQIEASCTLSIAKELPSAGAARAEKASQELKALCAGVEGCEIKVVGKLGAGDKYKTIKGIVPVDADEAIDLEHKQGEAWLLDFWATWCPPCQRPMAHNQDMLERRGGDWGKDVRIIGLSIDQTKDAVKKHVDAKKWTAVEHFHRAKSDCSEVYGVSGVPHVMLIDKEGTIVFKGHPASRPDLEKDLDDLSNGVALTGEGIGSGGASAAAEESGPAIPEGYEELDGVKINKEIDDFKGVAEALQRDETLKASAKKMPRCFCVMVFDQQYVDGKFYSKYDNYRVLVGPRADIDKVKATLDEKVTGSFKIVLREQAV